MRWRLHRSRSNWNSRLTHTVTSCKTYVSSKTKTPWTDRTRPYRPARSAPIVSWHSLNTDIPAETGSSSVTPWPSLWLITSRKLPEHLLSPKYVSWINESMLLSTISFHFLFLLRMLYLVSICGASYPFLQVRSGHEFQSIVCTTDALYRSFLSLRFISTDKTFGPCCIGFQRGCYWFQGLFSFRASSCEHVLRMPFVNTASSSHFTRESHSLWWSLDGL